MECPFVPRGQAADRMWHSGALRRTWKRSTLPLERAHTHAEGCFLMWAYKHMCVQRGTLITEVSMKDIKIVTQYYKSPHWSSHYNVFMQGRAWTSQQFKIKKAQTAEISCSLKRIVVMEILKYFWRYITLCKFIFLEPSRGSNQEPSWCEATVLTHVVFLLFLYSLN